MSTLSNVINEIKLLLEGKDPGMDRAIPTKQYRELGPQEQIRTMAAGRDPRPFTIITPELAGDIDEPSDIAGDYRYMTTQIVIIVSYTPMPHERVRLTRIMADAAVEIRCCIEWPYNWVAVDGWTNCVSTADTETAEDDDGNKILDLLMVTALVEHREQM